MGWAQRFRNQRDGRTKMTAGRGFLDFRDGEQNRNGLSEGKDAGDVGPGLSGERTPLRMPWARRYLGYQRTSGPRRSGGGFMARWQG